MYIENVLFDFTYILGVYCANNATNAIIIVGKFIMSILWLNLRYIFEFNLTPLNNSPGICHLELPQMRGHIQTYISRLVIVLHSNKKNFNWLALVGTWWKEPFEPKLIYKELIRFCSQIMSATKGEGSWQMLTLDDKWGRGGFGLEDFSDCWNH